MADRSICPLSTYYAGCGTTRKNRFCDTHPLRRILILFNIISIIGQISTKTIHASYGWGLTPYKRLRVILIHGGEAIHSNKGLKQGHWMDSLLHGFSLYPGCCFVVRGVQLNYDHMYRYLIPMQHISYIVTKTFNS